MSRLILLADNIGGLVVYEVFSHSLLNTDHMFAVGQEQISPHVLLSRLVNFFANSHLYRGLITKITIIYPSICHQEKSHKNIHTHEIN